MFLSISILSQETPLNGWKRRLSVIHSLLDIQNILEEDIVSMFKINSSNLVFGTLLPPQGAFRKYKSLLFPKPWFVT